MTDTSNDEATRARKGYQPPVIKHRMVVDKLRQRFRKRLLLFNGGQEYEGIDVDVELLLEDVGFAAPRALRTDLARRRERQRDYQREYYHERLSPAAKAKGNNS